MNLNENFSRNVRERRLKTGRTMDQFSSELGIGKSTLQGIEQRKSNCTLETVQTVADKLEVSPLALLSDELDAELLENANIVMAAIDLFRRLEEDDCREALDAFVELVMRLSKTR